MNSYSLNYSTQNKGIPYQNYRQGPIVNPIQASLNNFKQIIPQYDSPQPINVNSIPSGYNPINMMTPQINPFFQQQNIRISPPNQNVNKIQHQYFNQNTPNIINDQTPMANKNLEYTKQNQISIQNNIIQSNSIINSNQNTIQGISNQVLPLDIPNNKAKIQAINKSIYEINPGNNLTESKINNLIKNSMIQNRKNEAMNGHPPIPIKYTIEAMKSISKISYYYNNKTIFGTGFFMEYSDSLKLLITNYHVIFPALMNTNIHIEIWNNKKITLNLKGRYIKFLEGKKDITAIEIKTTDEIYKDLQFLNYDYNYYHKGYNIYKDKYIFSIEHPLGQDAAAASGKIN